LPVKPIFLPLVTRLTVHLARAENERTMALAGAPVPIPLGKRTGTGQAEAIELEVVHPSGEVVRVREPEQAADTFRYADTHEPGVYLVRLLNRNNPPAQFAFAVNIDPAEPDPTTITRAELQARFGARPLQFCESPAELGETLRRLHEGTGVGDWCLTAVLIGLVLEIFLANRGAAAAQSPASAPTRPEFAHASEQFEARPGDEVHDFLKHLEQDAAQVGPHD
jgi:hypothetical protein